MSYFLCLKTFLRNYWHGKCAHSLYTFWSIRKNACTLTISSPPWRYKHTHHLPKGPCFHVCVCVETTKREMDPKHRSYLNIFWSPEQSIVTYRLLVVRHMAPTYSPRTSKTTAIETTVHLVPCPQSQAITILCSAFVDLTVTESCSMCPSIAGFFQAA